MKRLISAIVTIIILNTLSFADGIIYGEFVDRNDSSVKSGKSSFSNDVIQGVFVDKDKKNTKSNFTATRTFFTKSTKKSALYISGALTAMASNSEGNAVILSSKSLNDRQVAIMGKLGYDFMDYLGVELRASYGILNNLSSAKFKNVAMYLKPNIYLSDTINIYGLFGCGKSNLHGSSNGIGLTYGVGVKYSFMDTVALFIDTVNYLDKGDTNSMRGYNFGFEYQF